MWLWHVQVNVQELKYPAVERQRRQDSCLDAPLVQRGERPGDRRVKQRHPRVDGRERRRGGGLRAGNILDLAAICACTSSPTTLR